MRRSARCRAVKSRNACLHVSRGPEFPGGFARARERRPRSEVTGQPLQRQFHDLAAEYEPVPGRSPVLVPGASYYHSRRPAASTSIRPGRSGRDVGRIPTPSELGSCRDRAGETAIETACRLQKSIDTVKSQRQTALRRLRCRIGCARGSWRTRDRGLIRAIRKALPSGDPNLPSADCGADRLDQRIGTASPSLSIAELRCHNPVTSFMDGPAMSVATPQTRRNPTPIRILVVGNPAFCHAVADLVATFLSALSVAPIPGTGPSSSRPPSQPT